MDKLYCPQFKNQEVVKGNYRIQFNIDLLRPIRWLLRKRYQDNRPKCDWCGWHTDQTKVTPKTFLRLCPVCWGKWEDDLLNPK